MVSTSTKSALADAAAGVLGSLVAMLTFYPVDVIKTNLQASNSASDSKQSSSSTPISQFSTEKATVQEILSYYFRGVHFKISHTIASSFAYFFLYSWIQTSHRQISRSFEMVHPSKPFDYRPLTSTRLLLAAVAAMMNTFITLPLDVLSARSQSETLEQENKRKSKNIKLFAHTSTNWKHLWKGLWPSLLLCSNPSIHFTVFDLIKVRVMNQKRQNNSIPRLTWVEAFLFGMIAKFTATIVTYPLIRAKVRLMVNDESKVCHTDDLEKINSENKIANHTKKDQNMTMTRILTSTYQHEGIAGLYKGCNLQLIHTLLKSALLMMVRERITATTRNTVLGKHLEGHKAS